MRIYTFFVFFLFVIFNQPVLAQQDVTLPEGTMAVRGNGSVSREMFDARISRIPEKDRVGVLRSSQRFQKILADLLITSQLNADARAAGFDKGDIQYRMKLAADGELSNAWLDHYVNSQPDADYRAMAYEYYVLNEDSFMTAPSRDMTHLLVSNKQQSSEEVEALAQSYLDQVTLDPSVFDQLVLQHSEDPSVSANQGHFREVKLGDMLPTFEDAAFSLKIEGEFSGLVHTAYGIHIIRLDKINPPRQLTFEEIQAQLESSQKDVHRERIRNEYLSQLGSAKWQISEAEVKAMVVSYFGEDAVEENSQEPESE